MDVVSSLSPTLWALLQRTRVRPDLVLELFDRDLSPLLPSSDDPRSGALRRAASIGLGDGTTERSFRTILEKGRDARIGWGDWDIVLLPVRDGGQPAALLVALTVRMEPECDIEWVAPGPTEAVARAWRDALEGDLVGVRRPRVQEQSATRSKALASLVADLQQLTTEQDVIGAVLQAIAVWHDVEPSAYARDLAGLFVFRGSLPGGDVSALPSTLEAGAVISATTGTASGIVAEWPIPADRGWPGARPPLLMLVGAGALEQWLIAANGVHDADTHEQLKPVLRGFSAAIERVREREAARLREELWETISRGDPARDNAAGVARGVLEVLARVLEARDGELTVSDTPGVPDVDAPRQTDESSFTADTLSLRFALGTMRFASLVFHRSDRRAFRPSDVTVLLATRNMLAAWLIGAAREGEWQAAFVAREPSRVLPFVTADDPSPEVA